VVIVLVTISLSLYLSGALTVFTCRSYRLGVVAALLALCFSSSSANVAGVLVQPSQVRLEQYMGGNSVVLWSLPAPSPFAGTSCQSFTFGGPTAEISRVWALVLAAKIANRAFVVQFNTSNCTPVSVALD
jgi:hypothetical protein